jgi:hypothetical protein
LPRSSKRKKKPPIPLPAGPKPVPAGQAMLARIRRSIRKTLQAPVAVAPDHSAAMWICTGLAIATFIGLILIMWAPFTMHSGFNGETGFIYTSETSTFWKGFLYPSDPLRPYTNFFYHVGYLLGDALGVRGSFVPHQIVHASLWLARGLLVFLILRKFLPGHFFFCFLAGAIVLVHASDGALQWIGQINNFGMIFWMLLGFYVLNKAVEAGHPSVYVLLTLLACFCVYMSLWSYEAQLFIVLAAPLTLIFFRRAYARRAIAASVLWYVLPLYYIYATVTRYRRTMGSSYQETVLRKSWNAGAIAADWLFNIGASLKFWDWTHSTPVYLPQSQLVTYGAAGASILLIGACAILFQLHRSHAQDIARSPARPLWYGLGTGIVLLILSFPVYVMLDWSRGLWRTQFLSGIGAAITMASIACLVGHYIPKAALGTAAIVILGTVVGFAGVYTAVVRGAFIRFLWERHRSAVAQILSALPSVRPETVILFTGVPKANDPFGHDMWFDLALRLAYPNTPVAGNFYYDDGSLAEGHCFKLVEDRCRSTGVGIDTLVKDTSAHRVVVLEFQPKGPAKIASQLPAFLHPTEEAMSLYSPKVVLDDAPISPVAVRRYGPIPPNSPPRVGISTIIKVHTPPNHEDVHLFRGHPYREGPGLLECTPVQHPALAQACGHARVL